MESPDIIQTGRRNPESNLRRFEGEILKALDDFKDKKFNYYQWKKIIRNLCNMDCEKLGLSPENAQKAAIYFFKYLDENPEQIHLIWEKLYEFSSLLKKGGYSETEVASKIDNLFELNTKGITLFWRLVHSITRGDLDVEKSVIDNEPVYYTINSDSKKRAESVSDTNRQKITKFIKEKVSGKIIEKPLPDDPVSIVNFNDQDRSTLLKIIIYLQQDADFLVTSSPEKETILRYFDSVQKFLKESIAKIELESGRSSVRKQRYEEYINQILSGYLLKICEYCTAMADDSEKNNFAADALLEPSIGSLNMLQNGKGQPDLTEKIIKRFKSLMKDIQLIIGENATRFNIPILTENKPSIDDGIMETDVDGIDPDEFSNTYPAVPAVKNKTLFFHPALSGEIPVPLDRTPNSVMLETGTDAKKIVDDSRDFIEEFAGIKQAKIIEQSKNPKDRRIDETKIGLPVIQGMPVNPFAQTVAVRPVDPVQPSVPQVPTSKPPAYKGGLDPMDFFDNLTGEIRIQIENEKKKLMTEAINNLKAQLLTGIIDLKTKDETYLLNKFEADIFMRYVQSDNLRRHFITECCRFCNDFVKPRKPLAKEKAPDSETKELIHSTISTLLRNLTYKVKLTYEQAQLLGESGNGLPDIKQSWSLAAIPHLNEFKFLTTKLSPDNPVILEIRRYSANVANKLVYFDYYFESLARLAEGENDAFNDFKRYFELLKQENAQMRTIINELRKKVTGGFFARLFGNKKLNNEAKEYFDSLANHIEWIWQAGIEPTMQIYGKLILGQHRRQILASTIPALR